MTSIHKKDWLWAVGLSMFSAILLFLPSLQALGGKENSIFMQIYEAFFHTQQPEHILGDGVDPTGSFWIVGFVQDVLQGKRDTIVPELYAPFGVDLGIHEGFAWIDTLFAIPLRWWIGSPGFYNLHVLLTLFYTGIASYALFRYISKDHWLSLLLSHLMVVNEFVYQEISYGRPTQANWMFACLCTLMGFRLMKHSSPMSDWKGSIGLGILLGAFCLTYWFGAVGLGATLGMWIITRYLQQKQYKLLGIHGVLCVLGVTAVVAPIAWRAIYPILLGKGSIAYNSILEKPITTWSFLQLPIYGKEMLLSLEDVWIFIHGRHFPIVLLLSCISTVSWLFYRKKWGWAILLCWSICLPFGSSLVIFEQIIPTPYAVLEWIFPPLVRCNFPDRLMVTPLLITYCSIALLWKNNLWNRTWIRWSVPLLLIANLVIVWKSHSPNVQAFQINQALVDLTKKSPGGLIEFPIDRGNQTYVQSEFHHQAILTGPGMMTIQPPASKRYIEHNTVLQDLVALNQNGYHPQYKPELVDILQLHKDGFRYFVFYLEEIQQPVAVFEKYFRVKGTLYEQYGIYVIPLEIPQ